MSLFKHDRNRFKMKRSGIISLLTDFGNRDGYVAAMHGVIYQKFRDAVIVDLSHEVEPQDVIGGAFLLSCHGKYFPQGTVHICVIDPGVGSDRDIVLAVDGYHFYLAPDNGFLSLCTDAQRCEYYIASEPKFWRAQISNTFHGRDIFAPLGAYLAKGGEIEAAFVPVQSICTLEGSKPTFDIEGGNVMGKIIYVDRFGNLITNIKAHEIDPIKNTAQLFLSEHKIGPILPYYSAVSIGECLATINSFGYIEIAVNGGSAKAAFPDYQQADVIIRETSR